MTKLKVVVLISTLLLTGCSSKGSEKSDVLGENALNKSMMLMREGKFSEAREILAFIKDEGYQVQDELIGQLDSLLLAEECYEAEKYEEAKIKIGNIFDNDNINGDVLERASYIKEEIANIENVTEENDNYVISDSSIDEISSQEIRLDDISASSYLQIPDKNYEPKQVLDGDLTTAWIADGPDEASNDVGEHIKLSSEHALRIDKIVMTNGFSKSKEIYEKNNRIKDISIEFHDISGNLVKTINHSFEDWQQGYQTIEIHGGVEASSITVYIESIYNEGATDNDACISEIITYGQVFDH